MISSDLLSARRRIRLQTFVIALGSVALLPLASAQETFSDDFERPDGPVDGWLVYQGDWNIAGGVLVSDGSGVEPWAWAGDPQIALDGDFVASFDVDLSNDTGDAVGRHGGIMFFASEPTHRYADPMTGYTLDWIDNGAGFRLIRWDGDRSFTVLDDGPHGFVDPPAQWEVSVTDDQIVVTAGGEIVVDVTDATYRSGHFGFWAYTNSTRIEVDNVEIAFEPLLLDSCFSATPDSGPAPLTVDFDASCTLNVNAVASYEWDFGDGSDGTGEQVSHEYQFPDVYTCTLTVTDDAGNSDTSSTVITVSEPVEVVSSFEDDFSLDDGPPEDWTIYEGDWRIEDEALRVDAVAESWIWAGDPPLSFAEVESLEFDIEFLVTPADGVGRHGGIMFAASAATTRWEIDGYSIDWIDRDGGFRLIRWDAGAFTVLFTTAGDLDPGETWRVEFDEDIIVFSSDDEEKIEFVDDTYRDGHFGFWAYSNNQIVVDNLVIGEPSAPPEDQFMRGDSNGDGERNLTDAVFTLGYLFSGTEAPPCLDAADVNDDGQINLTDATVVLLFLFQGGADPAPPFPACGVDPTGDVLSCDAFPPCEG